MIYLGQLIMLTDAHYVGSSRTALAGFVVYNTRANIKGIGPLACLAGFHVKGLRYTRYFKSKVKAYISVH
jgi:hypothetical protein